jgi:hypothetical protein
MALLYGRAGRLTAKYGGFRPWQTRSSASRRSSRCGLSPSPPRSPPPHRWAGSAHIPLAPTGAGCPRTPRAHSTASPPPPRRLAAPAASLRMGGCAGGGPTARGDKSFGLLLGGWAQPMQPRDDGEGVYYYPPPPPVGAVAPTSRLPEAGGTPRGAGAERRAARPRRRMPC